MQINRTELSRRLTGNGPIHHYGAPTSLPAGGLAGGSGEPAGGLVGGSVVDIGGPKKLAN